MMKNSARSSFIMLKHGHIVCENRENRSIASNFKTKDMSPDSRFEGF